MVPLGFWRKNKIGDKKFGNKIVKKERDILAKYPFLIISCISLLFIRRLVSDDEHLFRRKRFPLYYCYLLLHPVPLFRQIPWISVIQLIISEYFNK